MKACKIPTPYPPPIMSIKYLRPYLGPGQNARSKRQNEGPGRGQVKAVESKVRTWTRPGHWHLKLKRKAI